MRRFVWILVALVGFSLPAYGDFGPVPGITPSQFLAAFGSNINSGHTTAAVTVTFPSGIALAGTGIAFSGIADPASGIAPGVGAQCGLASNTTTPLPATYKLDCYFTASGAGIVRAIPYGITAITGSQAVTLNLFWNW